MKKEEYEEEIIEGKKVKIKISYQPHGAWASHDGKTITLNEKSKQELKKDELNAILLHERGHHTIFNQALTWVPTIIILATIIYLFYTYSDLILGFFLMELIVVLVLGIFFSLFIFLFLFNTILNLIIFWIKEIHADWYTIKRTKKDVFRKTLKKLYSYNKKVTRPSFERFYNGVILHPPWPLRLKIIQYMEKRRDRKA